MTAIDRQGFLHDLPLLDAYAPFAEELKTVKEWEASLPFAEKVIEATVRGTVCVNPSMITQITPIVGTVMFTTVVPYHQTRMAY